MRRLLLAPLLVLTLTGATCMRRGEQAPVGDAAAICYTPDDPVASVDPPDTGVRWTCADPEHDPQCWDALGEKAVPALASKALSEARGRQACVRFIDTLKERGRLRAPKSEK